MRCKLSIFEMLFQRELKSYNRAHKQKTKSESKRQDVASIIKDFHLTDKFLLSSAYSRVRTNRKNILEKRSEFSLIRADKILIYRSNNNVF